MRKIEEQMNTAIRYRRNWAGSNTMVRVSREVVKVLHRIFPIRTCSYYIDNKSSRSSAYNIPGIQVDGTDFFSVYETTKQAVDRAKKGLGPTIIESKVERLLPHTTDDDHTKYRSSSDIEHMIERDPIPIFENQLVDLGVINKKDIEVMKKEVISIVNISTDKVENEAFPSLENMLLHSDLN